jgi:predicted nucleic acid-binding protein
VSRIFADTSGLFALLVSSDANHAKAKRAFRTLEARQAHLLTSSYVLVETYALIGRRVGLAGVRSFREDFAPLLEIVWVDAKLHERGLDLLLERASEKLSLVDAVSFEVIRHRDCDQVFAFDRHFVREGLELCE